jgi:hypothetical protein
MPRCAKSALLWYQDLRSWTPLVIDPTSSVIAMPKLYDFLVEHAKFPFPHPEHRSASTTDISQLEVGLLEREWKAKHAVRDDTLVQKLCDALEDVLVDAPLEAEDYLLASFSPKVQFDERGGEDRDWSTNSSEAQVIVSKNSGCSFEASDYELTLGQSRSLLDKGFFVAARKCLWEYDRSIFETTKENMVKGATSKVDYVVLVDNEPKGLCEAKPPSVMEKVGNSLPPRGIELKWVPGQPLVPKILAKVRRYSCRLQHQF